MPHRFERKGYHAYLRVACSEHTAHSVHLQSHDDTSWLLLRIVEEWHKKHDIPCRAYRWRAPYQIVSTPDASDMEALDELPF